MSAIRTLGDLATPEGTGPFLRAFAAKDCWHLRIDRPEAAQWLLPWATIETLVSSSLAPVDTFRVVVNANELPGELYTDARGRLRAEAVQGFAAQGATLVLNDIGALVPAIGELTTAMERELRCRIGVNCYVTFGELSAFRPHHDNHDVLVLQIQGVKRWRRYGQPVKFPIDKHQVAGQPESTWEGIMAPGDLLYLPRGEVHSAIPEDRPSVHLTFGINEPTGADVLQWLAVKAKASEALRRDLGATLGGDDRMARDAEFATALRALTDGATVADFLADKDRERPLRPLASLGAAGHARFSPGMTLVSALRRRLDLATDQEGEAPLILGGRTVRLSQLARRALTQITDRHRITVVELAGRLGCEAGDEALALALNDLAAKSLIAAGS